MDLLDDFSHLLGRLIRGGLLNNLGFFLNFDCLCLKLLDGLIHLSDLGADSGLLFLILVHLGDLSLDVLLVGFNGSLKTSDFIEDLGPFRLILDGGQLGSKLNDLLLFNGDLLGVGLGVVLVSGSLASKVVSLLLVVLLLLVNLLLGLLTGMSMSLSLLLVRVDLGNVSFLVVLMATSVGGDSLELLILFLRVVGLSSDVSVVGVVSSPVHHHVGHLRLEDVDLTLVLIRDFLVSLDLILDVGDLSGDRGLLLLLGGGFESLGV